MTSKEITDYFYDRIIGSTVLTEAHRSNSYWNQEAAWLAGKVAIISDSYVKKLASDIVKEAESFVKDGYDIPNYDLAKFPEPYITLSEYAKLHKSRDRESIERNLAGTLWDNEAR